VQLAEWVGREVAVHWVRDVQQRQEQRRVEQYEPGRTARRRQQRRRRRGPQKTQGGCGAHIVLNLLSEPLARLEPLGDEAQPLHDALAMLAHAEGRPELHEARAAVGMRLPPRQPWHVRVTTMREAA